MDGILLGYAQHDLDYGLLLCIVGVDVGRDL